MSTEREGRPAWPGWSGGVACYKSADQPDFSWVQTLGPGREFRGAAAMQQIADWLDKLGMTEYAQRFAENRIDLSVLPI